MKLFASQKGTNLDFSIDELLAFIGLNIAMGMLRLPQARDYWSTNEILATPWFAAIMLRDRFFHILRFLHLVDSTKQKSKGEGGYDPLSRSDLSLITLQPFIQSTTNHHASLVLMR